MADYDIGEAFQKIEEEMIASMSRNLKRHLLKEKEEGLNYAMWQAEQLSALNNYRKDNKKKFEDYFSTIDSQIESVLNRAYEYGAMDQEIAILEAIQEGYKIYNYNGAKSVRTQFFKINERKMNALIEATQRDMAKAEVAMLRRANDEYRKIIFNTEVFYNSGAGTLRQCVDMATKDFLSKGIACIEYANGTRVGIDVYSSMALRTAQTRAYLQGEATKRDEWGINTVIVNRRGVACPKCLQWVGKVYYDDVWGNSEIPNPPKYKRLSEAIAGGLYHPNCKDVHTTFFEDVSEPPKPLTKQEEAEANRVYELEQQQRYNERQIRKYKRLSNGAVDPENQLRYQHKFEAWRAKQVEFVKANGDVLKRRYENESIRGIGPINNKDTSKTVESMKREVAKIKDMRTVLGEEKIPKVVDILEKMPYNEEQMRYVNLDYARRKHLIEHPELKLPNAESATIDDRKFTKYLYNPENAEGWAKGRGIASRLGYDETNWRALKEVIDSNKDKFPVKYTKNNGFDDLYEQKQVIYGLKGKPANVLVSWAKNKNGTHLTSIYLKEV
jgi:hypothetical protein